MDIRGPRHRHLDLSRRERGAFGRGKEERGKWGEVEEEEEEFTEEQ